MFPDDGSFLVIEWTWFVEDVAGDADLADIVQQRAVLEKSQSLLGKPKPLADGPGQRGGFARVRLGMAVLGVEGGGERLDGRQVAVLELQAPPLSQLVFRPQRLAHQGRDIRAYHHRRRKQDEEAHVITVPSLDRDGQGGRNNRTDQHSDRCLEFEDRGGEHHNDQVQDR